MDSTTEETFQKRVQKLVYIREDGNTIYNKMKKKIIENLLYANGIRLNDLKLEESYKMSRDIGEVDLESCPRQCTCLFIRIKIKEVE